mgnify:CR=1 FL=1
MNLSTIVPLCSEVEHVSIGSVLATHNDNFDWLPDDSVDFVLTDPPFNIARDTNFHTYEKNTINSFRFDAEKGWDTYSPEGFRNLLRQWTLDISRVLRPGGNFAIFCADAYLSDLIDAAKTAGLKPRRTLTWRKPNAVPVNRKHMMMSACEYVVLGVKGSKSVFNANIDMANEKYLTQREIVAIADKAATTAEFEIRKSLNAITGRITPGDIQKIVSGVLRESASAIGSRSINIYSEDHQSAELCVPNFVNFNSKAGNRLHPTEKPVALLKYLIELFSSEGELVLDPFSGSASTGEAAYLLGREAIIVERDTDFYQSGVNRLKGLINKPEESLFS